MANFDEQSITKENYSGSYDKHAEEEDNITIYSYMEDIGGDVTKIVQILACDNPPKDVMSVLKV